jgi:phosphatidylglycerophosphate synthase
LNFIGINELRKRCQSVDYGYEHYPLMFRSIRLISIYFTWVLVLTRITPNAITVYGIVFGVLSAVAFVFDYPIVAVLLAFLAVIADFSDGEVSRFKGLKSKEGTYLDKVHHLSVHPFFIAGLVIWSADKVYSHKFMLAVGMLCVLNSILLPVVVMYAADIAVLKHLQRKIENFDFADTKNLVPAIKSRAEVTYFKAFAINMVGHIQRLLDFPYVIMYFSCLVLMINFYGDYVNGMWLLYGLSAYSCISSILIALFIWHVLRSRNVERRVRDITLPHRR